ncbi:MAG: DUF2207 domain-containing protein, partial [Planctomycetota bacterium]
MRKWLVLPLLALAVMAAPARAEAERILHFHSEIAVNRDGSLNVRETIKVRAEGRQIKRGIYRDFPDFYSGRWLTRRTVPFQLTKVLRDGRPEPHHMELMRNGKRIYIGREDVFLRPGTYTYTLEYRTDRQLGHFEDHDELYWNATGTGWAFHIERVTATVTLPDSVPSQSLKLEGYTGPQGAKGKDFTSAVDADGRATFATNQLLPARQGLSIVVSWPKGHVREPTAADLRAYFLQDNFGLVVGALGVLIVFAYYMGAWLGVGRDPERGLIIPLFEPPEGFSPAAVRYLMEMGYDAKCLTAAIINMAVKGFLTLEDEGGNYTLARTGESSRGLAPEEKKAATKLLRGKNSRIELEQENHTRIGKAIKALKEALALSIEKRYLLMNTAYFVPGLILSAVVFLAAGLLNASPEAPMPAFIFICIWLTGWSFGVALLLAGVASQWRAVFAGGPKAILALGGALGMSLFALPFIGGELLGLFFLSAATSIWMIPVLLALVLLAGLFHYLLKAPSRRGRVVMDQIEGFRMYLGAAEGERLNLLNEPEKTPELFEEYLPYALALDVENEWAEQFSEVLARAARSG